MAKPKKEAVLSDLVTEGFNLRQRISDLLANLKAVETKLVALGAGPYADEAGNSCLVVGATEGSTGADRYALPDDGEEKARVLAGDDDLFKKLFSRHVSYSPCEGFNLVAPKLLTPARARDLVSLCLVPGRGITPKAGYVKWKD